MADSPGLFTITAVAPPAIGTQTVSDNFNRANQTPITGNWTTEPGNEIYLISNAATPNPGTMGADTSAIWNTWASGNDQYSQGEITVTGTSAGSGMGVCVRHSATASIQTMYRAVIDAAGNIDIAKLVTGGYANMGTRIVSYAAGRKLGLSATGGATTTLKVWYNGVQVGINMTDASSPILTGLPGVAYSSVITTASLDNWDAGTVP